MDKADIIKTLESFENDLHLTEGQQTTAIDKESFDDLADELLKQIEPKSFEEAVKPLMKWMAENHNPHTLTIVRSDIVEVLEGVKVLKTDEFILD